jgi:hypothetical protein
MQVEAARTTTAWTLSSVTTAMGSTPAPRRCRQASGCSACANASLTQARVEREGGVVLEAHDDRRVPAGSGAGRRMPAESRSSTRRETISSGEPKRATAKRVSELAQREHVLREQCQSGARDGVPFGEDDGKIHVGAQFAGDAA